MTTIATVVVLLAAAAGVVAYLRWSEGNYAALKQRDATLQAEQERRHATEQAEATAAAARKQATDEEIASAHSADDAARVLREALDRTTN